MIASDVKKVVVISGPPKHRPFNIRMAFFAKSKPLNFRKISPWICDQPEIPVMK
jgi:hypothetical protein